MDARAAEQYPELDGSELYNQLAMVKQMTAAEELSLDLVVAKLVGMDAVVHKLFPPVEVLVRLLLTIVAQKLKELLLSASSKDVYAQINYSNEAKPSCCSSRAPGND